MRTPISRAALVALIALVAPIALAAPIAFAAPIALVALIALVGCADEPKASVFELPDIASRSVNASFDVTIYGAGPGLFDVGTATKNAYVNMPSFFESLLPEQEALILRMTRGDRDLGTGDKLQQLLDFRQRPDRKSGHHKAPSLRGVWDNVLFMHDGRHASLEGVIGHLDKQLGLGLSADDIKAVTGYVTTL